VVDIENNMVAETRPFEILLVEDSQADAGLVREALREHHVNCSLRVISDGAQAIEFIDRIDTDSKAPPLDLLLLDMRLPRLDGGEVLKRLRSTERYAQTPVIVMTGLSSSPLEEKTIKHNAMTYFEKPSTLEEFMQLGSIVCRILEQGAASPGDQTNRGGAA
jgi:CheY-like chemotaxis protein